mmetsp:Transcript_13459/g.31288  ORF Transcript_13459/g.31288 Transcript_13459/m.31288 type:complete len:200 (-) Transcript_13459:262-861(-)
MLSRSRVIPIPDLTIPGRQTPTKRLAKMKQTPSRPRLQRTSPAKNLILSACREKLIHSGPPRTQDSRSPSEIPIIASSSRVCWLTIRDELLLQKTKIPVTFNGSKNAEDLDDDFLEACLSFGDFAESFPGKRQQEDVSTREKLQQSGFSWDNAKFVRMCNVQFVPENDAMFVTSMRQRRLDENAMPNNNDDPRQDSTSR